MFIVTSFNRQQRRSRPNPAAAAEYRRRPFCLFSTRRPRRRPDDAIDIMPSPFLLATPPPTHLYIIIRIFSLQPIWLIYPAFQIFYFIDIGRFPFFFVIRLIFGKLYTRFTKRQCAWHDSYRKRTNTHTTFLSFFCLVFHCNHFHFLYMYIV